ncbi:MAG TPA: trehalose-phosphatase [Bryobacteraceae bacterium]|nr:trehalose-phosphatase [Bryobacteraceae bacterium]
MTATVQARQAVSLLDNFEALSARITEASHVGLFLDFDGTISRIVLVPKDAEVDSEIAGPLRALAERSDFTIAIVSGRALADLRERVGLKNAIYVGNHGLEIEAEDVRFREPEAEALRRELRCLVLQLKLALSETDGLEIEDKGLTLSVHFRRVTEELQDWVRSVTCSTVGRSRSFACREGKMVLEVFPRVDWHKGRAVKWIAREVLPSSPLLIYLGDDVTDEDAFAAIQEGITIKVGGLSDTAAQYALPDVAAVGLFLKWLNHSKPHASRANLQRAGR